MFGPFFTSPCLHLDQSYCLIDMVSRFMKASDDVPVGEHQLDLTAKKAL